MIYKHNSNKTINELFQHHTTPKSNYSLTHKQTTLPETRIKSHPFQIQNLIVTKLNPVQQKMQIKINLFAATTPVSAEWRG